MRIEYKNFILMEVTMKQNWIETVLLHFHLGTLLKAPCAITGGITNQLYQLTTTTGQYAIKIMNPTKLKEDPDIIKKLEISETIATKARLNGVNAICAISFDQHYVNENDGIYFLIYPWCDGTILTSKEITPTHLKLIAKQQATLHKIKVTTSYDLKEMSKIDYSYYYNLVKFKEEPWALFFKKNFMRLQEIYEITFQNYQHLSKQVSYVHKDLNRKNILWQNETPYIIDWETATISNPSLDFFNSAWFLTEDIKKDKYKVFTKEYLTIMNLEDPIEVSIYSAIIEECKWLEFSLKRALGLYSSENSKIELGKASIESSLTEIINYFDKIPFMIQYLKEVSL